METIDKIILFIHTLLLGIVIFAFALISSYERTEQEKRLNIKLGTIQETLSIIQNTLQDSTLLLKKNYYNGNMYIDLWQGGKEFE